jgi:hypothetical protein
VQVVRFYEDLPMCWKCQELDAVIEHYRPVSARTADRVSLKGIELLIEKFEGDKRALHQESS